MKNSNFQNILLAVFAVSGILAVFIFAGVIPMFKKTSSEPSGNILIWGTVKKTAISPLLSSLSEKYGSLKINYIEKNPATFDKEFIEALASGVGPDLFFLPQDYIFRYQDKVLPIPFSTMPERTFKNNFIQEGELYLINGKMLGIPLTINPMVMYWNRDIFSSAGISNPPSFWDEFVTLSPRLTKQDPNQSITQSAVALGQFRNVLYAKDIVSTLVMQIGNNLIVRDENGNPRVNFYETKAGTLTNPVEDSFRFFTDFADSAKPTYSWNQSLPNSKQAFVSERLAIYFGYASELLEIRNKNPHLNFDVTLMPQPRGNNLKINFGKMNAIAVTKASKNPLTAISLALLISDKEFSSSLASNMYMPPPRRDLLALKPNDPYLSIFYDAALTSRAWLDVSPETTDQIFSRGIDNIVSGKYRVSEAISLIQDELEKLAGQ